MAIDARVSQQVVLFAVPESATTRVTQMAVLYAIPSVGQMWISQQVILYIKGRPPNEGACPVPNAFGVPAATGAACDVPNDFGAE